MIFNRQLYKQKPSAWGPVSNVQTSIFKNAEKLGIDPASIALAMPMWGPGNQLDYGKYNLTGVNTNTAFINNGLIFSTSNITLPTIPITLPVIFYARVILYQYSYPLNDSGVAGILSKGYWGGDSAGDIRLINDKIYNRGIAFQVGASASAIAPLSKISLRTEHDCMGYCDGATAKLFVDGKYQGQQSVASYSNNSRQVVIGAYPNNTASTEFIGEIKQSYIFNTVKESVIPYLSDNPYYLLHRVPPVFYSLPGGAITIKTITDTVSCLDEIAKISNIFALSDTGTCLDGFSGLIAGLSVTDAGAVVDTVKPIASLTVQDTGSAIDLIQQISAACSVADTGTGADSIGQLLASLVVSDAGAVADVITVLKELLKIVTDSGAGTDSISRILASLSVADTGSSTDTISQILAGVSVSDTGTGVDFIALLKDILKTISDTGSGSDSISIQPVSVSVQDAGTALDIIGHIAAALSVSDIGTISEIISTIKTKLVNVTDAIIGYDAEPNISVSVTVSDTAAALDIILQVLNMLSISDSVYGFDRITKTDFDILPSGKVTVTFTLKTPGASLAMRTPKANFNIE